MSSTESALLEVSPLFGVTEPRVECYPEHTTAKGDIAIEWCRSIGLDLLPWQEYALSVLLGEDDMHKYACREFGYIVARQNGKGSVLMARELAGLFLFNEGLILHSAHEFKTAQEAFLRTAEIIDNNPELVKQLKGGTVARGKRTSHGEEGYELASGARLRFVARSKSSGRGFSADVIVLDEAYELSEKAISALRHTIKTRPNPQIIYTSTAPPIDEPSTVLRQVRKRALENSASRFGYLEWSAPYEATQDLANIEYWRMANPALGYLFELDALQSDYEARASDDEFAIEVLSITNDLMDEEFISPESWASLIDMTAIRQGAFSVGLSVSEKGKNASVAIAAREAGRRFLIRLVHQQRSTKDLVGKVAEIVNKRGGKVHLNAGAPAGSLILDLKDAGVEVQECNTRAYAQACGALAKSVDNDELRHPGQPSLNLAVKHAKGRKSGDLWVWATGGDADITPLEAVTLALQGFRSSLVEEVKPAKVSNAFYSYA